ncbi:poly polymerase [Aspergillus campestris IBT 28561]|uniref:Poly [ADP-ribose] polymerase n=1 Tax=Aspergillus campestris (strain IBT 28561) TaxID=1392248 RepID=A0A2I1CU68_ASPC2|nr:poly polymerase [Aspergillus campestris IBT 28561]PKY01168.1 poly polymerase [Aspergillus campestris IBT 28561]
MSSSFKDIHVTASGSFSGYTQAEISKIVKNLGGSYLYGVEDNCTHFITNQREVDRKNSKYIKAIKVYNCEIVSIDWLIESQKEGKPLAVDDYALGISKDKVDGKNKANGTKESPKKKRTLEEVLHEDVDGDDDEDSARKRVKDAQTVGSKKLNIPVDEACFLTNRSVYIDDEGLIWDAALNQTVAAANNNKFYRLQLLVDPAGQTFSTWTRWGRVGEVGQSALLGDNALETAKREFEKKFKAKSGLSWEKRLDPPKKGKYTFIERNYEEDSDGEDDEAGGKKKKGEEEKRPPVQSTLTAPVQDLMSFIFNKKHFMSVMASMSYDALKLPLGKLSKRTLRNGFQILKDLSELAGNPALAPLKYNSSCATAMADLSDQYFTTIPHVFGRNRPPVLNTDAQIKKEIELLEALTEMEVANTIMESKREDNIHELDRQFQSLGMEEMTALDHTCTEFQELLNYLQQSRGSTHRMGYQIINIFRIERQGETERFESSPYADLKNSNRRLLWHGSRSTNFGGILSQGLRIAPPEAPVSGYMFGKGVYFADISSKSAGYTCSYNSGGTGLLLLCDVELGDPMLELNDSNYNADSEVKKAGKYATLGRGSSIPGAWTDAGCVHDSLRGVQMPDSSVATAARKGPSGLCYNEYIVYDVAQIRQRYLFQVKIN